MKYRALLILGSMFLVACKEATLSKETAIALCDLEAQKIFAPSPLVGDDRQAMLGTYRESCMRANGFRYTGRDFCQFHPPRSAGVTEAIILLKNHCWEEYSTSQKGHIEGRR
jgi:hypothetical protein